MSRCVQRPALSPARKLALHDCSVSGIWTSAYLIRGFVRSLADVV
jgi:hypothetical protein